MSAAGAGSRRGGDRTGGGSAGVAGAAQVVEEAPGGGDGAGGTADGLGGGADRGPGQAGGDREDVGQQVTGFLEDAGAGRQVRTERGRVRVTAGPDGDVVQFPLAGRDVAVVRDQAEQ